MTVEAIIYARYSKADQAKGHSMERQLDYTRALCDENDWSHSPARTFVEKGKSAFSGANRAKGSLLHTLEEEIALGLHIDRFLVCEHLDRISRQGYEEVLDFVRLCTANGVSVATVDGRKIYRAYERVGTMDVMEVILKSELAREESQKKSTRIRAALKGKRDAAQAGSKAPMHGSRTPQWIEIGAQGEFCVVETRGNVVREIFELAANDGLGTHLIAKRLNQKNVPPFREGKTGWHEMVIQRILANRAAIGEYTSHKYAERVIGYYPPVIDVDLFNRVQAARASRKNMRGRRGESQSNLFSGRVICAECGGSMYLRTSRRIGGTEKRRRADGTMGTNTFSAQASYLGCDAAQMELPDENGNPRCTNKRTVRYEYLEPVVLEHVLQLALDEDSFKTRDFAAARIALAEADRI